MGGIIYGKLLGRELINLHNDVHISIHLEELTLFAPVYNSQLGISPLLLSECVFYFVNT